MPLNDYYENIEEINKPEPKPVKKDRPTYLDPKLIFYLSLLVFFILFIFIQFLFTYIETANRNKVPKMLPIAKMKMRAIGSELDAYYREKQYYPPSVDNFKMKKQYFNLNIYEEKVYFTAKEIVLDPFMENQEPFRYRLGPPAVKSYETFNPDVKIIVNPFNFWMLYSKGPDKKDDNAMLVYDPTNGYISAGDIITWSSKGRKLKSERPGSRFRPGKKKSDDSIFE